MRRLILGVLGLLPVLVALGLVLLHAENVVIDDEFRVAQLLQKYDEGTLGLADFFERHVLHRIFFPLLVMFGLALATGFNCVAPVFVSMLLLAANLAISWAAFSRLFGKQRARSAWFLPVPFLVFSFSQFDVMLDGWELTYVMPLSAALATFLELDRLGRLPRRPARFGFARAAVFATLASFSSTMGLMVWIAALWPLWFARPPGRSRRRWIAIWLLIGTLEWTLYFFGFDRSVQFSPTGILTPSFWQYVLELIGTPISFGRSTALPVGIILATLAVGALARTAIRKRGRDHAFWLASLSFCGMSIFAIALARLSQGATFALAPRYCLYGIPIAICSYVLLLDHAQRDRSRLPRAGLAILTGVMLASIPMWYLRGFKLADMSAEQRMSKAFILATYRKQPAPYLRRVHPNAKFLMRTAPFLERKRYNVFARSLVPQLPSSRLAIDPSLEPAGFSLINGKRPEQLADGLETMQLGYGFLHLKGWALDPAARDTSGGVFIAVGGHIYPALCGLKIKNPGDHSRLARSSRIGFERAIPIAQIGLGRHEVSLLVSSRDGMQLYPPIPVATLLVR